MGNKYVIDTRKQTALGLELTTNKITPLITTRRLIKLPVHFQVLITKKLLHTDVPIRMGGMNVKYSRTENCVQYSTFRKSTNREGLRISNNEAGFWKVAYYHKNRKLWKAFIPGGGKMITTGPSRGKFKTPLEAAIALS